MNKKSKMPKMLVMGKILNELKEKYKHVKFFDIEGMDWVVANSFEEMLAFYEKQTGINLIEEECDVKEIDPIGAYRINLDTNIKEPYLYALDQDMKKGGQLPDWFATTEW